MNRADEKLAAEMSESPRAQLRVSKKIVSFGIVGAVGFCVDAGVLQLLFVLGAHPVYARLASFPLAVTATWLLNRRITFSDRKLKKARSRYALYVSGQLIGGLLNVGIFALTVKLFPEIARYPVLPLAIGSIVAMFFNYVWANTVVFRRPAA